jgi:hypothetical protein
VLPPPAGRLIRIDTQFQAALTGDAEPVVAHVCDHHLASAQTSRGLGDEIPYWSATEHEHGFPVHTPAAGKRVNGNRSGFDHLAEIHAHARRQSHELRRLYREVFGCGPRCLEAHHLQIIADVVRAVHARIACSANKLGLDRDVIAFLVFRYLGSDLLHNAGYFMPLADGV